VGSLATEEESMRARVRRHRSPVHVDVAADITTIASSSSSLARGTLTHTLLTGK
jgi:hypothetical protein